MCTMRPPAGVYRPHFTLMYKDSIVNTQTRGAHAEKFWMYIGARVCMSVVWSMHHALTKEVG